MRATIEASKKHDMIENWRRGELLKARLNHVIARHGLRDYVELIGYDCLFALVSRNALARTDDSFRTLMMQEKIARGILFQGLFYPTWSHQQTALDSIEAAFDGACVTYSGDRQWKLQRLPGGTRRQAGVPQDSLSRRSAAKG